MKAGPLRHRNPMGRFIDSCNAENYHSGIAYLHPDDVHAGQAAAILSGRQTVLDAPYQAILSGSSTAPQRSGTASRSMDQQPDNPK